MFFIINKEKLTSYAVSIFTVAILFAMAGVLAPNENTIETSSNISNQIDMENENTNTLN